ncbi:MAG TPA: hypothetical protein VGO90_03735 [Chthoniobacteraceae bacterium]|jgi:hypothetical protein|nr:hypothetical protein [Chthoniobacteraceae bacterium]
MKATIRDLEILRAVRPLEVVSYLRAHQWKQVEKLERGAFWIKEEAGESFEVLLPLDTALRDFPNRIAEVLATLEQAEKRSQLEIVEDLSTTSADVVRPRLLGANHAGEISIERGRIVYEQARNLMLAAACAALEKRPLFARRKPEQAMNFLEHAHFGPPQRGSYVLTIISPVSPKLTYGKDLLGEDVADEPFERKTMRTLAEAISALEVASREVAASGELDPMKRAVQRGVSANLCEAIIGLHEGGGERGVEFAFSWAPLREAPANIPRFAAITPDFISIIRETARLFRETETTHGIEVFGVVNRLEHQGEDHGRVTIAGSADGVPRNIVTELSGADHLQAVRSYKERVPISCVGELMRDGRSWVLRNPREVQLVVNDVEQSE